MSLRFPHCHNGECELRPPKGEPRFWPWLVSCTSCHAAALAATTSRDDSRTLECDRSICNDLDRVGGGGAAKQRGAGMTMTQAWESWNCSHRSTRVFTPKPTAPAS